MTRSIAAGLALASLLGVSPVHADIVAAVLPTSRAVQVGQPATAFATIINTGLTTAVGCSLAIPTSYNGTFAYQTTNPLTNVPIGNANAPVDIPAGASQTFVFGLTPLGPDQSTVPIIFDCTNTEPAVSVARVNTFTIVARPSPIADMLAIASTPTHDGIVATPGAFSVAVMNIGATPGCEVTQPVCSCLEAGFNVNVANQGVPATVCRTFGTTGECMAPPQPSIDLPGIAGQVITLSVFTSEGNQPVPFDPANNRINVVFRQYATVLFPRADGSCSGMFIPGVPGRVDAGERGGTSVAVGP
jgi:hypothetical protein